MTIRSNVIQESKLNRTVTMLENLGYSVNVHANEILRSYLGSDEQPTTVHYEPPPTGSFPLERKFGG